LYIDEEVELNLNEVDEQLQQSVTLVLDANAKNGHVPFSSNRQSKVFYTYVSV